VYETDASPFELQEERRMNQGIEGIGLIYFTVEMTHKNKA
jgi:hypothetical protein